MSLHLANTSNGDLDASFAGKFEPARDDMDALLIFDGTSFRMEQVAGQIKTRCVPGIAMHALCHAHTTGMSCIMPRGQIGGDCHARLLPHAWNSLFCP